MLRKAGRAVVVLFGTGVLRAVFCLHEQSCEHGSRSWLWIGIIVKLLSITCLKYVIHSILAQPAIRSPD